MNGTYLQHKQSTPFPSAHTYYCSDLFGFTPQTINPRWHHILRMSWETPWSASFSATWRYIGSVSEDNNTPDPTLHYSQWGTYDASNETIPSFSSLDLQATWIGRRPVASTRYCRYVRVPITSAIRRLPSSSIRS